MTGAASSTKPTHGASLRPAAAVAALGVVFGDIGTSPLYAFREAFESDGVAVDEANALGIASMIFWSLIIVVTIKYLVFVLRADNDGEGGILSLAVLADRSEVGPGGRRSVGLLMAFGLFGTALLYGDGMITPAISVLSAVEGAELASPALTSFVVPIAVVILIGLFAVQHRGTGSVGRVFGPIMICWFATLAVLGAVQIAKEPAVLRGLSPTFAVQFFIDNGFEGFLVLGSVFLVVTGGEALYADLGHFGASPIRLGWFALVFPALTVNYLGQTALLISEPDAIDNPFFRMAPTSLLVPMTILATIATVIASQALITGVFSLTSQAIQLDYLPRMQVTHTSATSEGQVYVPAMNWTLMVACILLVLWFRSSSALAAAYGVAVTMTMLITTGLVLALARRRWKWSIGAMVALGVPLVIVDGAFLGANLFKIPEGGWFPLLIASAMFLVLTTWHRGRNLTANQLSGSGLPLRQFVESLREHPVDRVPGTGVYLVRSSRTTPPVLVQDLRNHQVLHKNVIVVSLVIERRPRVPRAARIRQTDFDMGFHAVEMYYGFMDQPDLDRDLHEGWTPGVAIDPKHTVYFVGKDSVQPTGMSGMATWRERLYRTMVRNSTDVITAYGLPPDRTEEVSLHVAI